jgi:metallo-beta-lactamase class B
VVKIALLVNVFLSIVLGDLFASEDPTSRGEIVNKDLRIVEVGKDVWRHISYRDLPDFGRSPANGLIILSGKEAALIDTPWSSEQTSALIEWVNHNFGAEISAVIVTHSHDDCMGGLKVAHDHGAVSYASEKTADLARENRKEMPRETFETSQEIRVGSRSLGLRFAGGGHTKDNIVVWIPDERILFGGCLVRSAGAKRLGYTREAELEQWPKTIKTLLEEYGDARVIVPGHGSPGGIELLHRTLELLQSAWRHTGNGE